MLPLLLFGIDDFVLAVAVAVVVDDDADFDDDDKDAVVTVSVSSSPSRRRCCCKRRERLKGRFAERISSCRRFLSTSSSFAVEHSRVCFDEIDDEGIDDMFWFSMI